MTNTQFYIGIAIPSILIILGWLHQNTRLADLRGDMHRGFDKVDQQFARVDRQFDKVDQQFARVDRQFDKVDQQFDKVDQRFEKLDQRFEKLQAHLGRIDEDLRNFHGTDKELEGRINEISARIK